MFGLGGKHTSRRQRARERRTRSAAPFWRRSFSTITSWPVTASLALTLVAGAIALFGEATVGHSVGERILHPIDAVVDFRVADPEHTEANRQAARAATPSYYFLNAGLTFDRIRADLMRLYEAAAGADTFEAYQTVLAESGWPAEEAAYLEIRKLADQPDDAGRTTYQRWVDDLPLEKEYVVRGLFSEAREPKSTTDYIVVERTLEDKSVESTNVELKKLVPQGREKALRGSAADVAKRFPRYSARSTVEAIVAATFTENPTITFNQARTVEQMSRAEKGIQEAWRTYEASKLIVSPGLLRLEDYELLRAHHYAYLDFLQQEGTLPQRLRDERFLQRAGLVGLVVLLCVGLMMYTKMHQPRIFEIKPRTIAFGSLILCTLLAVRILDMKWPHIPELLLTPVLVAGSVLAIVYPRRFAVGATCMMAVIAATLLQRDLVFLITMLTGATVIITQLNEIRSRTKLISAGTVTAAAVMLVSAAGGFLHRHAPEYILQHVLAAGGCALLAAFLVSGVLPFIERVFRIATSLTLLEWRDPTRPLLQLLAQEAPGTYNHSLVIGTLAAAACERIGANGLLAQVGALYHDIGKIPKADYFAENQEAGINRHDNLAPTMSLLIILGHVKDGVEMAKEYKLPRVLRQFIEEHHGTTVVRYFHHVASVQQPKIASGKHDREVREAGFRYSGPKPRTRESAVVMLCDGVESAVRCIADPTVGRIEAVVHQMVTDRLHDGQFDNCDMTMRQLRDVEDALVKSLCGIYHGRVAYPKASKPSTAVQETGGREEESQRRLSG